MSSRTALPIDGDVAEDLPNPSPLEELRFFLFFFAASAVLGDDEHRCCDANEEGMMNARHVDKGRRLANRILLGSDFILKQVVVVAALGLRLRRQAASVCGAGWDDDVVCGAKEHMNLHPLQIHVDVFCTQFGYIFI